MKEIKIIIQGLLMMSSSNPHNKFIYFSLLFSLFLLVPSITNAVESDSLFENIRISEIDTNTEGTDVAEFVELYDGGLGNTALDGLSLVFFNGNGDKSYRAYDLDGQSTNANGYFVLCGDASQVANCNLDVSPSRNLIQNGTDGVALYIANKADFPTGTPVTTSNLLDAVVYGSSSDEGLLALSNIGNPQLVETIEGSIQRCPSGEVNPNDTNNFMVSIPSAGIENNCVTNINDVGIRFSVRAILQGAFNGTDMSDDLRVLGLIPEQEPYTERGYKVTNGQSLNTNLLLEEGDNAIVDWVLLKIHDGKNKDNIRLSQVALLQRDGDVVMPETANPEFSYDEIPAGNYYLSIHHRNHQSVISGKLALGASPVIVNFADTAYYTQGEHARLISSNKAFLWSGDSNNDNKIIAQGNANDINSLLGNILVNKNNKQANANYIVEGYLDSDINLDGKTIFSGVNNDVNSIMSNVLTHPSNDSFSANFMLIQTTP